MSTNSTTSAFKIRLRARPAVTAAPAPVVVASTASASTAASHSSSSNGAFLRPTAVTSKTSDLPTIRGANQLQKTPTPPTSKVAGRGLNSVTLERSEELPNWQLSNTTTTTTQTTGRFGTSYSATHSLVQERFELERKAKLIEENPALFTKFSYMNLRLNNANPSESSSSSNDENDQPEESGSPEYVPPARLLRKVIRAYSADDSVVEVLPDHVSSFAEPSFVKGINNGILQLPNSIQKIGSSALVENEIAANLAASQQSGNTTRRPPPAAALGNSSSKKRLPSLKKNLDSNSKNRPWLKQFPPKDTSASGKAGRVLRPLNLDSCMAAAAGGPNSTSLKPAKSLNSLGSQSIEDMEISSIDESPLKSARSMPALEEPKDLLSAFGRPPAVGSKTSETVPSATKMPPPKEVVPVPTLKSLKMLGAPKVPKLPDAVPAATPAKAQAAPELKSTKVASTPSSAASAAPKTITIKGRVYQILNKIGRGGSAVVYQVFDLQLKVTLALKVVDLSKSDKSVVLGFRDEIKLLHSLRDCKRVVRMIDYEFRNHNKELVIVMEKGDDDLSKVIHSFQAEGGAKLNPHVIRFYWQEMVKVVNEIHMRNIVHSDLKPVNFIIVSGKLKLIDFGIANKIQSNKTSVYKESIIGTVDFMAPESFQKKHSQDGKSVVKYNQKADIWSLGVILYTLVYGATPFAAWKDNWQKGTAIINEAIDFGPIEDQLLLDVIKQCLTKDPTKRPTAADLLKHPYLATTDDGHQALSSRTSSSESLNQTPAKVPARIPTELLSKLENLTPTTLRNISKMVEESLSKK